jgi:predicted DNA-binding transcriptional regulator AlpA
MPIRVLSSQECDARTGTVENTRRVWVKQGRFPAPVPLGEGGRLKGYLESEIEDWIKQRIAARDSLQKKPSPGRQKFWADVAAGLRLHPRTAGRLRRDRAQAGTSQRVVVVYFHRGENRQQLAADRADAQRLLERLRKENPTAASWMCERVTRQPVPAQESDDAGAS